MISTQFREADKRRRGGGANVALLRTLSICRVGYDILIRVQSEIYNKWLLLHSAQCPRYI